MTDRAADTAGLLALIDHEENYLIDHFDAECGIMPGDVEGSFHRLREAVTALRAEINCLTAALAEAEKKLKDAEWEASDAEQQCDKFEARALAAEAQLTAASSRIEALGGAERDCKPYWSNSRARETR